MIEISKLEKIIIIMLIITAATTKIMIIIKIYIIITICNISLIHYYHLF